jgi:hypothetical protein
MSFDEIHRCSICGKPTYFSYRFYTTKPRLETDQGLYEIGCSQCGEYRIAPAAEAAMARQSPMHRATIVKLIQAANARGNRYCLNDGREVTLNSVATPGGMAAIPSAPRQTSAVTASHTGAMAPIDASTLPTSTPSQTPERRLGE